MLNLLDVRNRRQNKKLSCKEMGLLLGISENAYFAIEIGLEKPTEEQEKYICELLHIFYLCNENPNDYINIDDKYRFIKPSRKQKHITKDVMIRQETALIMLNECNQYGISINDYTFLILKNYYNYLHNKKFDYPKQWENLILPIKKMPDYADLQKQDDFMPHRVVIKLYYQGQLDFIDYFHNTVSGNKYSFSKSARTILENYIAYKKEA